MHVSFVLLLLDDLVGAAPYTAIPSLVIFAFFPKECWKNNPAEYPNES